MSNHDYYRDLYGPRSDRNPYEAPHNDNFVATPSYHYYVQQQQRHQGNPAGTTHLHPTISDHSDTTTTYVEYQLDDLLADEPSMQQQQQRQHEKKKAKKKKVPRVPRFRRDKRAAPVLAWARDRETLRTEKPSW